MLIELSFPFRFSDCDGKLVRPFHYYVVNSVAISSLYLAHCGATCYGKIDAELDKMSVTLALGDDTLEVVGNQFNITAEPDWNRASVTASLYDMRQVLRRMRLLKGRVSANC